MLKANTLGESFLKVLGVSSISEYSASWNSVEYLYFSRNTKSWFDWRRSERLGWKKPGASTSSRRM